MNENTSTLISKLLLELYFSGMCFCQSHDTPIIRLLFQARQTLREIFQSFDFFFFSQEKGCVISSHSACERPDSWGLKSNPNQRAIVIADAMTELAGGLLLRSCDSFSSAPKLTLTTLRAAGSCGFSWNYGRLEAKVPANRPERE